MIEYDQIDSLIAEGRAVLAQATGFADARVDALYSIRYEFDSNGREQRQDRWHYGLGIRVLDEGTWGFAAVEGDIDWKRTLDLAHRVARAVPKPQTRRLGQVASLNVRQPISNTHLPFAATPFREAAGLVREAVPDAESVHLRALIQSGLRGIVNNEGTCCIRDMTTSTLSMTIQVRAPSGKVIPIPLASALSSDSNLLSNLLGQLDLATSMSRQLSSALDLETRECAVVLGPSCAGYVIHEAFGHLCEADRVPMSQVAKLPQGMTVGTKELNIRDRADIDGACGSMPFDDEGSPCKIALLVIEGRWVGLLHSRETAAAWDAIPTGNARVTSFRFPPLCRMRVTELCSGSADPSDIISSVSDGLYLDRPYGGHLRGPQFHLSAIDVRRIRDGKLAESYAGAVLVAQPLTILREIMAIGNDSVLIDGWGTCSRGQQKDLPVSVIAPTIFLRRAMVAPF